MRVCLFALALLAGCYHSGHLKCEVACDNASQCTTIGFDEATAACNEGLCSTIDHDCNDAILDAGGEGGGGGGGGGDAQDSGVPPIGANAVAAGSGFACAIDVTGQLSCWGDNSAFEVSGAQAATDIAEPTPQPRGSGGWTQIAAGGHFACGIENGDLYCWGDNSHGQCGPETGSDQLIVSDLAQVLPIAGAWTRVATGDDFACALGSGEIYCWGNDSVGQYGDGVSNATDHAAHQVLHQPTVPFVGVWAGPQEACGLLQFANGNSELDCWGDQAVHRASLMTPSAGPTPMTAGLPPGDAPTQVSIGRYAVCALLASHHLSCWGDNTYGTISLPASTPGMPSTQLVPIGSGYDEVATGGTETCAISAGVMTCWGTALGGALGTGFWSAANSPHVQVATGASHVVIGDFNDTIPFAAASSAESAGDSDGELACAVVNNELSCWGQNRFGQLGTRRASRLFAPSVAIEAASGSGGAKPSQLVSGDHHSCVLRGSAVTCWGATDEAQADGATRSGGSAVGDEACGSDVICDVDHPAPIAAGSGVHARTGQSQLAAGRDHTCALEGAVDQLDLVCWGADEHHQLGYNGNGPFGREPISQPGPLTLFATADQGCFTTTLDQPSCWGFIDLNGQSTLPTDVSSFYGGQITGISFNDTTGVVVRPVNATAWTGSNLHGEYGFGSAADDMGGPFNTGQLQNFSQVVLSQTSHFACGLDAGSPAGNVYCWGDPIPGEPIGERGVLGQTRLDISHICSKVVVGAAHICALCDVGLVCMGDNTFGQLGVPGLSGEVLVTGNGVSWVDVSATAFGTCAIDSLHQVQCWGDGAHGELGNRGGGASWPGQRFVQLPQPAQP